MVAFKIEKNKFGAEIIVPLDRIDKEFFDLCRSIPGIDYHSYNPKGFKFKNEEARKRLELILSHGASAINGVTSTKGQRPTRINKITTTKTGKPFDADQMKVVDFVYNIICEVLRTGDDSLISKIFIAIDAYPGTGKTTLLVALAEMLAEAFPDLPILMVSFTNTAVNEFAERMGKFTNVTVSTIHKMAYDAVKQYFGNTWRTSVVPNSTSSFKEMLNSQSSQYGDNNENKVKHVMRLNNFYVKTSPNGKWKYVERNPLKLYTGIVELLQGYDCAVTDQQEAIKIIKRHKRSLFKYYVPNVEEDSDGGDDINYENVSFVALQILKLCDNHYKIDYPDFNNVFQKVLWSTHEYCRVATKIIPEALKLNQFKIILLDEYQDSNISQHNFVKKLRSQCNAGVIAIGNIVQAIYAYSGCLNGYALKEFYNHPTSNKFKLTFNKRSTVNVIKEWAAVKGLKYGIDIKGVHGEIDIPNPNYQNVSFEQVLEKANDGDAILLHYNKDVFIASLALIEAGKFISLKNSKFFDNFKGLIEPIQESKQPIIKDIKTYYINKIAEYVSWGEEKYADKIKECQTALAAIMSFLKVVNLPDTVSTTKLFDYLDTRIRPNGITVCTVHTFKGCECFNAYCDKVNNFNLDDEDPVFAEDEGNKKLVMLSRAKNLNYLFDIDKKVKLDKAIIEVENHVTSLEIPVIPEKKSMNTVTTQTISANDSFYY